MSFSKELPKKIDAAVLSGVINNIYSRIGKQAHREHEFPTSFEREVWIRDSNREEGEDTSSGPSGPHQQPRDWIRRTTQRCCFSMTSVVCGLIYLDRLSKDRRVMFSERSWVLIWVSLMLLSEKFWEDNYIHPGHVLTACFDDSFPNDRRSFTEMQSIQFWLVEALDWRLCIGNRTFQKWMTLLRAEGSRDPYVISDLVFVPRPMPNTKKRLSEQSTSTRASTTHQEDRDSWNTSTHSSRKSWNSIPYDSSDFEDYDYPSIGSRWSSQSRHSWGSYALSCADFEYDSYEYSGGLHDLEIGQTDCYGPQLIYPHRHPCYRIPCGRTMSQKQQDYRMLRDLSHEVGYFPRCVQW